MRFHERYITNIGFLIAWYIISILNSRKEYNIIFIKTFIFTHPRHIPSYNVYINEILITRNYLTFR